MNGAFGAEQSKLASKKKAISRARSSIWSAVEPLRKPLSARACMPAKLEAHSIAVQRERLSRHFPRLRNSWSNAPIDHASFTFRYADLRARNASLSDPPFRMLSYNAIRRPFGPWDFLKYAKAGRAASRHLSQYASRLMREALQAPRR